MTTELSGQTFSYNMKSTSADSVVVDDILLRETSKTRLLFRPMLVNNMSNPAAPLQGTFIFQRHTVDDNWEDHKEFSLSSLKTSEWIKLQMNSEEILVLFNNLSALYRLYKENGLPQGEVATLVSRGDDANLIKQIVKNPSCLKEIALRCEDVGFLVECLRKLPALKLPDLGQVVDRLAQLS